MLKERRRRDSNPRAPEGKRISSAPRYDHFDTSPDSISCGCGSGIHSFIIIAESGENENPEIEKSGKKCRLIVVFLCLYRVCLSLSRHLIALEILIVCCDLVDEVSARYDLHDTVCSRLDDLMVS